MRIIILLGLMIFCSQAHAQVYRWVDENGQVHFSDRKKQANAEDITEDTKVQNIDTSKEELSKVGQILRKESAADRDLMRRQAKHESLTNHDSELAAYCRELRNLGNVISGPVYKVDGDGKEMRYTERERQADDQEVQRLLKLHCNGS